MLFHQRSHECDSQNVPDLFRVGVIIMMIIIMFFPAKFQRRMLRKDGNLLSLRVDIYNLHISIIQRTGVMGSLAAKTEFDLIVYFLSEQ